LRGRKEGSPRRALSTQREEEKRRSSGGDEGGMRPLSSYLLPLFLSWRLGHESVELDEVDR